MTAFRLFAYGTLRPGGHFHSRYCQGLLGARPARVRGDLYDMPFGYPAMTVPPADVLRVGNPGAVADLAAEAPAVQAPEEGPWVRGDLLDLPAESLPALDGLEGFGTPHEDHLYLRVLLPVVLEDGSATAAWTYVWAAALVPGVHLPAGVWPAPSP